MKITFYPKLAWNGIWKNKRLYIPYILTGSVMVMMYYILNYLTESPALSGMIGGSMLMIMLSLGSVVIAVFSMLFLFYTNSFLIRQRYREFGLYNILGMNKHNIRKMMFWESFFVVGIVGVIGCLAGIGLSKASELILLNLLQFDINYELYIGVKSLGQTILVYGVIYLVLLMNSFIRVSLAKPLELMQSNKVGERIPKRNWIYAVAGVILLGCAYYLAVSIEEPMSALLVFFAAVLLVIAATYLLFISGSVAICKLLQKNKKYYYKANHFVSVSSMVYRMKRNGAGLASICILLTMVLVTISSTASLYFGIEDAIQTRYPAGLNLRVTFNEVAGIQQDNLDVLRKEIRKVAGDSVDLSGVRAGKIPGLITEEGIQVEMDSSVNFAIDTYDNLGYLSVISLEDYNRMMNKKETLKEGECLIYCDRLKYTWDTFTMQYGEAYKVKKMLPDFIQDGEADAMIMPTIYMVVEDFAQFIEPIQSKENSLGLPLMVYDWQCGFDMDSAEEEIKASGTIREILKETYLGKTQYVESYSVESKEAQKGGFIELYGSIFFLGIMLSFVFLLAAVLIIYYKQISEGYEDQSRFEIMQKVGMTKKDIRRSINSQMLTVFFSPLVFAGIHLCFAFPFLWKILMLFGLNNMQHIIWIMGICFLSFGVFYGVVYQFTSNSYYSIVSGGRSQQ